MDISNNKEYGKVLFVKVTWVTLVPGVYLQLRILWKHTVHSHYQQTLPKL